MILLEFKLKGKPQQYQIIDDMIGTAQFVRNKALRYWMDNHSAATNIFRVAVGHIETKNGRGEKVRLSVKKAHLNEASTNFKPVQLSLF